MSTANGRASTVLRQALAYLDAGLSLLPVARDGTKRPDGQLLPRVARDDGLFHATWDPFKERLAAREDVERWFRGAAPAGIGVIGGAVSGGLECIDFDARAEEIYPEWRALVEAEAPGLPDRLSVARTPKPGYHVRFRCPDIDIPGNTKLAMDPAAPRNERCLIETRGEGGYALAPGCPPECHPTRRLYEHFSGPSLERVQAVGVEEREVLIRCARSFDRAPAQEERKEPAHAAGEGLSPGDDFDKRGPSWEQLLRPHGWAIALAKGGITYWRRPGKQVGWSATTGACTSKSGRELFAVFSTSADPFPGPSGGRGCSTHSKFGVYALLNHRGDFGAAARALAQEGYGDRKAARGDGPGAKPLPFAVDLLSSADFDAGDYRLRWLCRRVLVEGQPCVVGGPKKALKTSLVVDLAVSLGSGTAFLGSFETPRRARVAVISGESGPAVLQATARRVCAARGIRLAGCDCFWGFRLPQLSNEEHVAALREALGRHEIKVLLFDPLYLALLAGQSADGLSAANLYQTGPLLLSVANACLDVNCTPCLVHHFRTRRSEPYDEPQLEDLSFSGIQEFSRQWVLLGRRSAFDPDHPDGLHRLWMSCGGSAGHSLLRAVDVYEGRLDEDFGGRTWRVEVHPPSEARASESVARAAEQGRLKEQRDSDDESKVLAALDRYDPGRLGASLTRLRTYSGVSRDRTDRAASRLVDQDVLEVVEVEAKGGRGSLQRVPGYRRRRSGGGGGEKSTEGVSV